MHQKLQKQLIFVEGAQKAVNGGGGGGGGGAVLSSQPLLRAFRQDG